MTSNSNSRVSVPGDKVDDASSAQAPQARSYSERLQAAVVEIDPGRPSTWDASWAAAFQTLKNDSEIHRDQLPELLQLIGHRVLDYPRLKSVMSKITSYGSLAAHEVFDFMSRYEAEGREKIRNELISAFAKISSNQQGGKVPLREIEDLVKLRGFTPIPHAVQEVAEEAAAALGENLGNGISLVVFEKTIHLLEQREGFCKSDLDILEGAFRGFDKDQNGVVDSKELQHLLESLDFCLVESVVQSLVAPFHEKPGGFVLGWKDFLSISRKRVQLEFDLCQNLFKECDDDEDGFLQPGETMRMVSKLGVSLLPETLADMADECQIDGTLLDFSSFWKMLQALRKREGFTLREADAIHQVFVKYDTAGRGEMPLRRVPRAIVWLGYQHGPGTLGKASKQVQIPSTGSAYMTEAQFLKLVRKHREAMLKATRKAYRSFANEGGAGRIPMPNLQPAVTRLNRFFVNDFQDWVKTFRPGAKVARKHVCFDYEEFRIIVLHCCDKLCMRIRKNCGFSEVQLSKLRIEFVKYAIDDSGEVEPTGIVKLMKTMFPQAQMSPKVRTRLKQAFEDNYGPPSKKKGLDWHTFLHIMRDYEDMAEDDAEAEILAAPDLLSIASDDVKRCQEVLLKLLQGAKSKAWTVTPKEIAFLVAGIAPRLTEAEATVALELLQEEEKQGLDGEFNMVIALKNIILISDLSTRIEDPKPHDKR